MLKVIDMILYAPSSPSTQVPPLQTGDRLSRKEFERRYEVMPEEKKAELLEGVVYVVSSVRAKYHARPHAVIINWLGNYWLATPGTDLLDNSTVRLDPTNEPQPDVLLRLEDGNSLIDRDEYVDGAPELVVEISASSTSRDLKTKFNVYRRNGVQEYLIWETESQEILWYSLQAGDYVLLSADDRGIVCSQVFPGLWLDAPALLSGEFATVMACGQQGLQTPEHTAFKQKLASSQQ